MASILNFMTSKKSLPIYFILLATLGVFAFRNAKTGRVFDTVQIGGMELPNSANLHPDIEPNKYEKILQNVMLVLREMHYSPKEVNDDLSKQIFKDYFEELDGSRDVFLQSDIEELRKKFENKIDDELQLKIKAEFFSVAGSLYEKRLKEVEPFIEEFLSKPFDFTIDETFNANVKSKSFPKDAAARKEEWRKRMKYLTLDRLNDLINQNETEKVKKSNAELEKEAREKVKKVMLRTFEGLKKKATLDEYFKIFVNTVTHQYDPHTDYFPPIDQRSFNETMSGSYYGIGAVLREEDGNIKIGSLTPGSPSEKSGEISQGDIILAVAQGDAPAEDIVGYMTQDVVKLIRGKENTEVRLTLKKPDGTIKIVKLIRQKLALESVFVKSAVVEDAGKKIGIIHLPDFYANFEDPNGRRCSKDVAIEIEKLKSENVDGIVLDLRNNGGGSLFDVIKIVGFFIPNGPIVQVQDKNGKITSHQDNDGNSTLWDGPLTVLVNEFSASASEILAGAIQDYKRGVVLGSTSTFGKGTVQRQFPLNFENNKLLQTDEYGSLKVTMQKFYRISGGSTQNKGVEPDVVLPDSYEYLQYREKHEPNSLSWDEIPSAKTTYVSQYGLSSIIEQSKTRVAASKVFNTIKTNSEAIHLYSEKPHTLNLQKSRQEQQKLKELNKQMDELGKSRDSLSVRFMKMDVAKFNISADQASLNQRFISLMSKDIYINEAVRVIQDMLKSGVYAKSN